MSKGNILHFQSFKWAFFPLNLCEWVHQPGEIFCLLDFLSWTMVLQLKNIDVFYSSVLSGKPIEWRTLSNLILAETCRVSYWSTNLCKGYWYLPELRCSARSWRLWRTQNSCFLQWRSRLLWCYTRSFLCPEMCRCPRTDNGYNTLKVIHMNVLALIASSTTVGLHLAEHETDVAMSKLTLKYIGFVHVFR